MIVVYRKPRLLWHTIGRWLIKTRTFSLVNLLAGDRQHIVPEFVPWYGSVKPVADLAIDYLRHPEKLADQRTRLRDLVRKLDHPGASRNVARIAMELMEGTRAIPPVGAGSPRPLSPGN
jgi:lipid-A-disaccharide synthase